MKRDLLALLLILGLLVACNKDDSNNIDNRDFGIEKTLFCKDTKVRQQRGEFTSINQVFRLGKGYGVVSSGDLFYWNRNTDEMAPILPEIDGVVKCIEISPNNIFCINKKAVEVGLLNIKDSLSYEFALHGKFKDIVKIDANRIALIKDNMNGKNTIIEFNLNTKKAKELIPQSSEFYGRNYYELFSFNNTLWATILYNKTEIIQILPTVHSIEFPNIPRLQSSWNRPKIFLLNGAPYILITSIGNSNAIENDELRVFSINGKKAIEEIHNNSNEVFFEHIRYNNFKSCNYCDKTYYISGATIYEVTSIDPIEWKKYDYETDGIEDRYFSSCMELSNGELLFHSSLTIYETNCK